MKLAISKRNFIFRALQTFLKHSLTLFIYYFSAFELSPEDYGEAVYYISIAGFILLFCDFGISGSITKFVADKASFTNASESQLLSKVLMVLLMFSVLILAICLIIFESGFYTVENKFALYLLFPYILVTPLNSAFDGFLMGKKDFNLLLKVNSIQWIFAFVSTYFLVKYLGLLGVMISFSLNGALLLIILLIFNHSEITFSIKKASISHIFKYAVVIGLGSLAYFLYTRFDIFILEYFSFYAEIGQYEIINRLFAVVVIPFMIYGQVQAPIIAEFSGMNKVRDILYYFKRIMLYVFLVGLVLALSIYFFFPLLIAEYLPQYANEEFLLINRILAGVLPLKMVGVVATIGFITPIGKAKITTLVTFIFGVLNIVLDIIFIKSLGFVGVFWATLLVHNLAIIIQMVIFYFQIKRLSHKDV